jgi:hypothetical protein
MSVDHSDPTPASSQDGSSTAEGCAPADDRLNHVTEQMASGADEGQFGAAPDATVRCFTCRQTFAATTQRADDVARLEGASDPADQSMLVPVNCPHCGAHGTLILRYGPAASEDEADVLSALERTPHDSGRG